MLGKIFQFVQADVRAKTTKLRQLSKKHPEKYETVESMFLYEVLFLRRDKKQQYWNSDNGLLSNKFRTTWSMFGA